MIGHLTDLDLVQFLRRCQKVNISFFIDILLVLINACIIYLFNLFICLPGFWSKSLRPGGVICLKDNTYLGDVRQNGSVERFFVDLEDSSMTRSTEYFEAIFEIAGMQLLLKEQQQEFPEELYPVMMYALC